MIAGFLNHQQYVVARLDQNVVGMLATFAFLRIPSHSFAFLRQAREALARLEKAQVMASNLRSEGGEDLVVVVVVVVVVFMYSMVVSGSLNRW